MGVISQNGIDYPVPSVPVQSDGSATDLTNAAVPTGQTIKSYLNSNLNKIHGMVTARTVAAGASGYFDLDLSSYGFTDKPGVSAQTNYDVVQVVSVYVTTTNARVYYKSAHSASLAVEFSIIICGL